jgi:murein DD-endopeptidase MepM/ murein hydrolase activator NlpD
MSTAAQKRKAHAVLEQWKNLSNVVLSARTSTSPSRVNAFLDSYLADNPVRLLHPLLLTWKGDNLFREAKFTQAIQEYRAVARDFPTPTFLDIDLRFAALEKVSLCHERLGDPARAARTLLEAAKDYPRQEPELRMAAAEIFERSRKVKEARAQYTAISKMRKKSPRLPEMKDRATRALGRLDAKASRYGRNTLTLSQRIARCLQKKDLDGLDRLASKTHFSIGVLGGQLAFADYSRTLKQLGKDLRASEDIRVNPHDVRGMGSKRYLHTSGWSGKVFRGDVTFFLTQGYRGWEWTGLLGAIKPDIMKKLLAPGSKPPSESKKGRKTSPLTDNPNSIADLGIKAPWPQGRYFRAGGINKYGEEQAAVTFLPWPFNLIALNDFQNRDCGWGPAGYYYDQGPTHSSTRDRYSVDFMSYFKGHAYKERTTGTPVLAVANGVVKSVREWVPSGDPGGDPPRSNRVIVDHYTDEELVVALLVALFTDDPMPRSHYSARYLHLSGPNEVPVSVGLYVEQGTVLGRMDNTGNSFLPHLHFSMHDNTNSLAGVRPTPMDGQSLQDGEEGKCMHSTNEPFYHDPHYNLLHRHSDKLVCTGATNNGGNIHIWGPIPTGHEERYKFKMIPKGDGYYNILHKYSGKYVCAGATNNGGNIHIWGPIPNGHEDRYMFKLIYSPPGFFRILHKHSGKYVCTGATNNGGNIHIWGPIPSGHENRYEFGLSYAF